jgi:hypothetical protein
MRARADAAAARAATLADDAATGRDGTGRDGTRDDATRTRMYGARGLEAVMRAEGGLNAAFDAWLDADDAKWWPSGVR